MAPGDDRRGAALGMFQDGKGFEATDHEGGRWPANTLFLHPKGCRRTVELARDGTERESWICVQGCPVFALPTTAKAYFAQFGHFR